MNMDWPLIGHRIKMQRKQKHLTQEQLAEKLSVTVGYISQMERGITKINLDMLSQISVLLETDLSFFVSGGIPTHETYLQNELLSKYMQLNPYRKKMVLSLLDLLLQEQEADQ